MAVGVAAWLPRNENLKENECQECLIQDDGIGLIWKRLASRAQVSGGEPGTIQSDRSNEISGVLRYCHALISHRCIVQLLIHTPTSTSNSFISRQARVSTCRQITWYVKFLRINIPQFRLSDYRHRVELFTLEVKSTSHNRHSAQHSTWDVIEAIVPQFHISLPKFCDWTGELKEALVLKAWPRTVYYILRYSTVDGPVIFTTHNLEVWEFYYLVVLWLLTDGLTADTLQIVGIISASQVTA